MILDRKINKVPPTFVQYFLLFAKLLSLLINESLANKVALASDAYCCSAEDDPVDGGGGASGHNDCDVQFESD